MGFFSSLGNTFAGALGLSSKGSGGTRDAFQQFEKYLSSIDPVLQKRLAEINSEGINPAINQFAQVGQDLRGIGLGAVNRESAYLRGLEGGADNLSGLIRSQAGAQAAGIRSSATQAARLAGGTRGGLAFGGGAGAIAAQAGRQSADATNQLNMGALLQGEQTKLNYNLGLAGLQQQNTASRLGLAQALEGTRLSSIEGQANLIERFRGRQDQFTLADLQNRYGLATAALGGGLSGQQGLANRRLQGGLGLANAVGGLFA